MKPEEINPPEFLLKAINGKGIQRNREEAISEFFEKNLSINEALVLLMRFEFSDGKIHTLEEVGNSLYPKRSKERVRQIEGKALRRLRHPKFYGRLRSLYGICGHVAYYGGDEIRNEIEIKTKQLVPILSKPLSEIEWSVRTKNCLHENGYKTIENLCMSSSYNLLNMRNFGKKCLLEVKSVLAEFGLKLRDENMERIESLKETR